jgi:hypothetical protein
VWQCVIIQLDGWVILLRPWTRLIRIRWLRYIFLIFWERNLKFDLSTLLEFHYSIKSLKYWEWEINLNFRAKDKIFILLLYLLETTCFRLIVSVPYKWYVENFNRISFSFFGCSFSQIQSLSREILFECVSFLSRVLNFILLWSLW